MNGQIQGRCAAEITLSTKQCTSELASRYLKLLRLRNLRKSRGVSQTDLANKLNVSQAAISKLESRKDMLVSTLYAYVEALGGSLDIVARFEGLDISLNTRSSFP